MYTTEFFLFGNGAEFASLMDTEELPSYDDVVRAISKGLRARKEFSNSRVTCRMTSITETGKFVSQDTIFVTTDERAKPISFEQ